MPQLDPCCNSRRVGSRNQPEQPNGTGNQQRETSLQPEDSTNPERTQRSVTGKHQPRNDDRDPRSVLQRPESADSSMSTAWISGTALWHEPRRPSHNRGPQSIVSCSVDASIDLRAYGSALYAVPGQAGLTSMAVDHSKHGMSCKRPECST